MDKKVDISVICTWGDGPDVLVTLDGKRFMCYEDPTEKDRATHGIVRKGSMELTRNEALELAAQLFKAAGAAKDLDDSVKEYFEKQCKNKLTLSRSDLETKAAEAA